MTQSTSLSGVSSFTLAPGLGANDANERPAAPNSTANSVVGLGEEGSSLPPPIDVRGDIEMANAPSHSRVNLADAVVNNSFQDNSQCTSRAVLSFGLSVVVGTSLAMVGAATFDDAQLERSIGLMAGGVGLVAIGTLKLICCDTRS